jgi:hypothetical protein
MTASSSKKFPNFLPKSNEKTGGINVEVMRGEHAAVDNDRDEQRPRNAAW